jgi:hypothetical protein
VADFKVFHEIDFDDHDIFIENILGAAVHRVENFTGRSLVLNQITARFESLSGEVVELPFGPVVSGSIVAKNSKNELIPTTDYSIMTTGFFTVEMASETPVVFEYQATTTTLPEPLKLAILWQAWEQFALKSGAPFKGNWKQYAADYRRPSKFL